MHVKFIGQCDENLPVCGHCVRRQELCSFSTGDQSRWHGREIPQSSAGVVKAKWLILPRVQEMELMHFFATSTTKTLCHGLEHWHWWTYGIPNLAFQNEYLLEILLALVCLHRSKFDPLDQEFWITCAVQYQNRALPVFFGLLSDVNDETCNAASAL